MAKYDTTPTAAPGYRRTRTTPGIHAHADASIRGATAHLGARIERVTDATATTLATLTQTADTDDATVGEALAAVLAARRATTEQEPDEHLFLYTDSDELVRAVYGTQSALRPALRKPVDALLDALPDPTMFSLILCDSDINAAHDLTRNSRTDPTPESTQDLPEDIDIDITPTAKSKAYRLLDENFLRNAVRRGLRGHARIYRKGSRNNGGGEYHILCYDCTVVVRLDDDTAIVVTQMHQHPDYTASKTYTEVDAIGD